MAPAGISSCLILNTQNLITFLKKYSVGSEFCDPYNCTKKTYFLQPNFLW